MTNRIRPLPNSVKNQTPRFFGETLILHVFYHPANLKLIALVFILSEAPAQGIARRIISARHRLSYDRHFLRVLIVELVESPTADELDTHRFEVINTYH